MAEIQKVGQHVHEKFAGLRNNIDAGEFDLDDLEVALNTDINDSNVIQRRKGFGAAVAAGSYHSLWSGAGVCLVVTSTTLKRVAADYTLTTIRSGITAGLPMSYYAVGARTYYSNGVESGVVENGVSRSWGLEVPTLPVVSAISGLLRAGRYQVAVTYLRSDGQESGASRARVFELLEPGGLRVSNIPVSTDLDVSSKAIYISHWNGETLYRKAVVDNSVTSVDIVEDGVSTLPLLTQQLEPPPAGQIVSSYNGRVLVACGAVIYPSEPYAYELFDHRATLTLESDITLVAPVTGGIFVGTDNGTIYLQGDDLSRVNFVPKADYGVIPGTLAMVQSDTLGTGTTNGTAHIWASKQGLCIGADNGEYRNLTQERFSYPVTDRGAGLVRRHRGMNQYVAVLQGGTVSAANQHE